MKPKTASPQAAFLREAMRERLRVMLDCPICEGLGKVNFKPNDVRKCAVCRGTGKRRDL